MAGLITGAQRVGGDDVLPDAPRGRVLGLLVLGVSGPRMANTTCVPSADVSTSFTSHAARPAVMRAVMLVSIALGEALARM